MPLDRLLIFGVAMAAMWFLLIRPQQQRQKQHKQTIASIRPGQRIVTIGGLVAEIVEVRDGRLLLRVADGSEMEYVRDAVARVLRDDEFVDEDLSDEVAEDDAVSETTDDEAAVPAPPLPPQPVEGASPVDEDEGTE